MEKGCLRCAGVLGGGVMPGMGLIDGSLLGAISLLKPAAITAAEKAAITEATALATQAGMKAVVSKINELLAAFRNAKGFVDLRPIVTPSTFNNGTALFKSAEKLITEYNTLNGIDSMTSFQNTALYYPGKYKIKGFAQAGSDAFQATLTTKTAEFKETYMAAVNTTYAGYQTAIIASIVAILIIVLIMIIIYLILRYRRKKKMKKKLQYIKLLEE
ncbi:hypothetical protein PFTANZ_06130 [Plasmodium falciparum Tanzania (2000708)]|uniref:Surface antigen n=1 Tax=Plasmodium falciparum Tanzania (2000708) TaxID=1036725 RepID=A0A024VWQ6_PLAFA|nr:hypothetical protein PFTANZ_06130 [Plasmodium falciparum Tanzania (2000708)]